jgi:hypothetical protein
MNAEAAANWALLVATLGIAIIGWHRGNAAVRRANQSDARAEEALELARSAEERADRLEQMQIEPNHVEWKVRPLDIPPDKRDRCVAVANRGTDTAHDVRLVADIQYQGREETHRDTVEPNESIMIDLSTMVTAERERLVAYIAQNPGRGMEPAVYVRIQITWRTELGVKHSFDIGEARLDP